MQINRNSRNYTGFKHLIQDAKVSGRLELDTIYNPKTKENEEVGNISVETYPNHLQSFYTENQCTHSLLNKVFSVPGYAGNGELFETYTPSIDGFEFDDVGKLKFESTTFFTRLVEVVGLLATPLMVWFAQCEAKGLPYVDPENYYYNKDFINQNEVLINKLPLEFSQTQNEKAYNVRYVLNGGVIAFNKLYERDPLFFRALAHFSLNPHLTEKAGIRIAIVSIDLCTKSTKQIMPLLGKAVCEGRIWGGGAHLYGIGTLKGKKFSDRVGRQSKAYKEQLSKIQPTDFDLQTLYIGSVERVHRVVIYNKEKRELAKGLLYSDIKTHVELRINCSAHPFNKEFFDSLFVDYFSPQACYFRSEYMLKNIYENFAASGLSPLEQLIVARMG